MDLWDAGALGIVETHGLTASIVAVDVMAKAAEVTVIGVRRVGGGLVAVSFTGDMASVTAAVESARQAVAAVGGTLTSTVVGRPAVPTTFLRAPAPTAGPSAGDPTPGDPVTGDPATAGAPTAGSGAAGTPTAGTATTPGTPAGSAGAGAEPKRRAGRAAAPRRRRAAPEPPPEPPTDRPRGT